MPVNRIEVRRLEHAGDPHAEAVLREARARGLGISAVRAARVYLLDGTLSTAEAERISAELLTNPVVERSTLGAAPARGMIVEVHPLPGVMDPAAQSVVEAVRGLFGKPLPDLRTATGWRYDVDAPSPADAEAFGALVANPVVHAIHHGPHHPERLPLAQPRSGGVRTIELTGLDDDALSRLSRDAHLFLDIHEMRAIREHYRSVGREPTEIELETLAQTWSEHCVHKTLKSVVHYTDASPHRSEGSGHARTPDRIRWQGRPGHEVHADGSVTIHNLLKSTVAAATHELMAEDPEGLGRWCLSVFKDNAGVVALDDRHAVCIKVETHNHPSAIEPYGGAATGIGGCIRDVLGTGLGAKPIANTDVFCVAHPARVGSGEGAGFPPAGCLPPRRVLTQVVTGVRDYGNRMGIPTLSGAVWFDDRYVGNPLVFCGCVGVMPRDRVAGRAREGDLIVALGGRTGRDGIHGATFSSAELTDTHADEFAHAVQIGNAIEEKRLADAVLRARDGGPGGEPLFHAITDCGAGGFSSAVGEMGAELGAMVHLDRAPLKYPGLTATEVWISEAQERMVLAVPEARLAALRAICQEEGVELAVLGTFGMPGRELVLIDHSEEVGRLSMELLHEGLPTPTRTARWVSDPPAPPPNEPTSSAPLMVMREHPAQSLEFSLRSLLSHPNIASKHWIIRQYDHEVQGNTVIKPLVGPLGVGPSDASVIEPVPGTGRGVALACGLATGVGDPLRGGDPYLMALAAIDECVRNLVCVGADPTRTAILDNFCWPSCGKPENLAALVRAAEGCYDAAKAYRAPFVSGKDSLNNQFTIPAAGGRPARTIEIPPTLLITGMALVHDLGRVVTSDAKRAGHALVLVGARAGSLRGSHAEVVLGLDLRREQPPAVDLDLGPAAARLVAELISRGIVVAAHDVSDGGALVAIAEMLIGAAGHAGSTLGAELDPHLQADGATEPDTVLRWAFSESPSRYVLEARLEDLPRIQEAAEATHQDLTAEAIAVLDESGRLQWARAALEVRVSELAEAWLRPLDW